ncbi:MAG: hypothetical protein ACTSVI_11135 [Promethearchaeota archaeon]
MPKKKQKGVSGAWIFIAIILGATIGYSMVYFLPPEKLFGSIIPNAQDQGMYIKQMKYLKNNSNLVIFDYTTTPRDIPGMKTNITLSNGSILLIHLICPYSIEMYNTFSSRAYFRVAITLNGTEISGHTAFANYEKPLNGTVDVDGMAALEYVSEPLSAGDYVINAVCYSTYPSADLCSFTVGSSGIPYNRTMTLQELAFR